MKCCCCSWPRWVAGFSLLSLGALGIVCLSGGGKPQEAVAEATADKGDAGDSPMFGGTPARNMANSVDKNIPSEWSTEAGKEKNIKWVASVGSKAWGGVVVAGGKILVGTNNTAPRNPAIKSKDKGILMCFRESDGKFLWQAVHDELPDNIRQEARDEGVASSPVVEGNRLYYVSNKCEVICASTEAKAGTQEADIVWRLDMIKDLDVFPHKVPNCSPLIAGDLLFVTTGNGADPQGGVVAPMAPSFIAINKKTGKVVWRNNDPGKDIMLGQWSNPVYAVVKGKPQVIFGGGDGWLRAFEPDTGKLIWKFDCNPKRAQAQAGGRGGRNYLVATPVVYDNKLYVGVGQEPSLGSGVGHFWCVDITKTGDLSPMNDNFDPKAEVNKNSGLVWHYGGKAPQGSERDDVFGRTVSTCAIHDGLVYIAELAGYLHCLDAKTGEKFWVYDLKAEIWGSPYYVDGKVFLGTGDSDVHIFAPSKVMKVLGKVEMDSSVYSTPVAAHGVLYVLTQKTLYAIANK